MPPLLPAPDSPPAPFRSWEGGKKKTPWLKRVAPYAVEYPSSEFYYRNVCVSYFFLKNLVVLLSNRFTIALFPVITRLNYPTVSDESFKKTVTNWKKNTRQRIKTQAKLDAKEAENVADADDLGFLIE